jgi:transposase
MQIRWVLQTRSRKHDCSGTLSPDIAHSLGIGENLIYRWKRQALGSRETAPLASGSASAQVSLSEHLELQKRLRDLEKEHAILKKALGIFSRSH